MAGAGRLLDEPFSNLDFALRLQMVQLLHELLASRREPLTGVYVTHDVREALLLSHRLILLSPRPTTIRRTLDLPDLPLDERLYAPELHRLEMMVVEFLLGGS